MSTPYSSVYSHGVSVLRFVGVLTKYSEVTNIIFLRRAVGSQLNISCSLVANNLSAACLLAMAFPMLNSPAFLRFKYNAQ